MSVSVRDAGIRRSPKKGSLSPPRELADSKYPSLSPISSILPGEIAVVNRLSKKVEFTVKVNAGKLSLKDVYSYVTENNFIEVEEAGNPDSFYWMDEKLFEEHSKRKAFEGNIVNKDNFLHVSPPAGGLPPTLYLSSFVRFNLFSSDEDKFLALDIPDKYILHSPMLLSLVEKGERELDIPDTFNLQNPASYFNKLGKADRIYFFIRCFLRMALGFGNFNRHTIAKELEKDKLSPWMLEKKDIIDCTLALTNYFLVDDAGIFTHHTNRLTDAEVEIMTLYLYGSQQVKRIGRCLDRYLSLIAEYSNTFSLVDGKPLYQTFIYQPYTDDDYPLQERKETWKDEKKSSPLKGKGVSSPKKIMHDKKVIADRHEKYTSQVLEDRNPEKGKVKKLFADVQRLALYEDTEPDTTKLPEEVSGEKRLKYAQNKLRKTIVEEKKNISEKEDALLFDLLESNHRDEHPHLSLELDVSKRSEGDSAPDKYTLDIPEWVKEEEIAKRNYHSSASPNKEGGGRDYKYFNANLVFPEKKMNIAELSPDVMDINFLAKFLYTRTCQYSEILHNYISGLSVKDLLPHELILLKPTSYPYRKTLMGWDRYFSDRRQKRCLHEDAVNTRPIISPELLFSKEPEILFADVSDLISSIYEKKEKKDAKDGKEKEVKYSPEEKYDILRQNTYVPLSRKNIVDNIRSKCKYYKDVTDTCKKLEGIVIAGGIVAMADRSSEYWKIFEHSTDMDIFVYGSNAADRYRNFVTAYYALAEISHDYKVNGSVVTFSDDRENMVQLIYTDAQNYSQVLYNFDCTHLQIGLVFSDKGEGGKIKTTPDYEFYYATNYTSIIRNNLRFPRLVKFVDRGFIPIFDKNNLMIIGIRMKETKKEIINLCRGEKITLKEEDVIEDAHDGVFIPYAIESIDREGKVKEEKKIFISLNSPDSVFGKKLTTAQNISESLISVKRDGRFRNAFDGYINKSLNRIILARGQSAILNSLKKIDILSSLPIYKVFDILGKKLFVGTQVAENICLFAPNSENEIKYFTRYISLLKDTQKYIAEKKEEKKQRRIAKGINSLRAPVIADMKIPKIYDEADKTGVRMAIATCYIVVEQLEEKMDCSLPNLYYTDRGVPFEYTTLKLIRRLHLNYVDKNSSIGLAVRVPIIIDFDKLASLDVNESPLDEKLETADRNFVSNATITFNRKLFEYAIAEKLKVVDEKEDVDIESDNLVDATGKNVHFPFCCEMRTIVRIHSRDAQKAYLM